MKPHQNSNHLAPLAALLPLLLAVASPSTAIDSKIQWEPRALERGDGTKIDVDYGRLAVPENRLREDARSIEIGFVRIPAHEGVTGAPLVYLTGGPGQSIVSSLRRRGAVDRWLAFRDIGDVILLDQRGTGVSTPNLGYRWQGETPLDLFRSEEAAMRSLEEVSRAARDHFRAEGVDLDGYTSEQSADDLDDLRRALGADKLSLFGFSYGTHLALSAVRRHGEHLDNVVLVGVEGPDHTYKLPSTADVQFAKLAIMVREDPELSTKIPDLDALLDRVLAKLNTDPMEVMVRDPQSGEDIEIAIGADGLLSILRRDIGDASDLPVFPRLLYSIDQGDPRLLEWFARKRFRLGAHAMSAIMDAASGASAARLDRIRREAQTSRFGKVVNFPFPEIGSLWDAPDLGPAYRAPIASNVRTLFLSGTLDWNTPPFQAEEVRWGFPNSSHIIVENAGHEQVIAHPNVQRAILAFLRGENVDDVTASFPPLRFVPLEGYDPDNTHPSVPRS